MRIDFKGIGNSVVSFVPDEALFEYERGVAFHIFDAPILLALLIHHDVELLHWLQVHTIKLYVHLDYLSGFLGDHVI